LTRSNGNGPELRLPPRPKPLYPLDMTEILEVYQNDLVLIGVAALALLMIVSFVRRRRS